MRSILLAASLCAVAADWPIFRGNPGQTGVADGKLAEKLEVLWSFKCGKDEGFEGTAAVTKGIVLAGSTDEHLYAIGLADGKQKWKYKGGPFKAPPAVKGGIAYIGDLDGVLHAVDAGGKGRKILEAGAELGGANFQGDLVLVASHDETLYALDKDGKAKWKFKANGPVYGAVSVGGGKTFLAGCDSDVHVIDIATGKADRKIGLGGQTGATAAVEGDMLYVGTMRNEVQAIDWKKGEVKWTYRPGRRAQAFFSSPAVTKEHVLIGSRDSKLHCIHRQTGEAAWTFATGGDVDSSPVVLGDKVVVGSLDGFLYVLGLAKGNLLQKIELDGPISASPAVIDGRVVIGTKKGTLYCLGKK